MKRDTFSPYACQYRATSNTQVRTWQHDGCSLHVLYSYLTPIAYGLETGRRNMATFNTTRYSVTTSKHTGYAAGWLSRHGFSTTAAARWPAGNFYLMLRDLFDAFNVPQDERAYGRLPQ